MKKLEEQDERPVKGSYGFMMLYMAFFLAPGCMLISFPLDQSVPREVAGTAAWYGAAVLAYGLYKILSYGLRNDLISPDGLAWFVALTRFIDKLR